jgi:hypothetical protein
MAHPARHLVHELFWIVIIKLALLLGLWALFFRNDPAVDAAAVYQQFSHHSTPSAKGDAHDQ